MLGLTSSELAVFKQLSTPIKIQDFLDTFPINWEKRGETYMSPRRTLAEQKMHCLEGALVAAVALWVHGKKPILFDLKAPDDTDHVVALYRIDGYWGAISKTNHAVLRFRDPVYRTLRELALSYFHEYFDNDSGKKMLRSHSVRPFNLRRLGTKWITTKDDLHYIAQMIDDAPHRELYPKSSEKYIRKADRMERSAGELIEWEKRHPGT